MRRLLLRVITVEIRSQDCRLEYSIYNPSANTVLGQPVS
jgi:hypothetical protein